MTTKVCSTDSELGADLATWISEASEELCGKRKRLEFWLGRLEEVMHSDPSEDRDRLTCELTRMVLVTGDTLHHLTKIFVRWSEQGVPPYAWDVELAERTDRLIAAVTSEVQTSPYRENCEERLVEVSEKWPSWCPDYHRAV